MANAKFEKGSKEFSWFGDFWRIVQKYWIPEDSDCYWDGVTTDINKLYEKYKSNDKMERFTKAIGVRFIEFLEEESRDGR